MRPAEERKRNNEAVKGGNQMKTKKGGTHVRCGDRTFPGMPGQASSALGFLIRRARDGKPAARDLIPFRPGETRLQKSKGQCGCVEGAVAKEKIPARSKIDTWRSLSLSVDDSGDGHEHEAAAEGASTGAAKGFSITDASAGGVGS
jgi:hypothetical protein